MSIGIAVKEAGILGRNPLVGSGQAELIDKELDVNESDDDIVLPFLWSFTMVSDIERAIRSMAQSKELFMLDYCDNVSNSNAPVNERALFSIWNEHYSRS